MTLQSSGAISLNDVHLELGSTSSTTITMNDTDMRWLADDVSGTLNMNSFYGKTSVKVVATASATPSGTSHTFSGVNFGTPFTGRTLVACTGLYRGGFGAILDQTSVTIGGVGTSGDDSGTAASSVAGVGAGVWAGSVATGSSGSVVVNWTNDTADSIGLILLSVSGISTSAHSNTASWNTNQTQTTSAQKTLNIPSNGVLIAAFAHSNTNNTTFTGVTERSEITFGGARLAVGFDNRKSSQTGDAVTASWSGNALGGGEARSYSQ